jgi:PAS domain S-box-containing protein
MTPHRNPVINSPFIGFAHHRIILDDGGKPFDYLFLEVNAAFEKLTGLKAENLIGKTARQAIPGIEKSEFDWIGCYGEIALNGGERELEQFCEALARCYRVHAYSEGLMTFTTTFVDVTASKMPTMRLESPLANGHQQYASIIENKLRETNQMLQAVMDHIPQNLGWKDRNSVYLGCNKKWASVAGLSDPSEIVGKTDYDLPWKKEEADFFRECDQRIMDAGTPELHIIEPLLQFDGKRSWVDTTKVPLFDEKGNVNGILVSFEDITERRLVEETARDATLRFALAAKAGNVGGLGLQYSGEPSTMG